MANKGYPKANEGERGESGEKTPKGATRADTSGQRKGKTIAGVGIGMADKGGNAVQGVGRGGMGGKEQGEFNSGRSEGNCYNHQRVKHTQN